MRSTCISFAVSSERERKMRERGMGLGVGGDDVEHKQLTPDSQVDPQLAALLWT